MPVMVFKNTLQKINNNKLLAHHNAPRWGALLLLLLLFFLLHAVRLGIINKRWCQGQEINYLQLSSGMAGRRRHDGKQGV
jgi:hypothetical protein